jgi:hypothetical protein
MGNTTIDDETMVFALSLPIAQRRKRLSKKRPWSDQGSPPSELERRLWAAMVVNRGKVSNRRVDFRLQ